MNRLDHARSAAQRIAARLHRCRSGVRVLPGPDAVVPGNPSAPVTTPMILSSRSRMAPVRCAPRNTRRARVADRCSSGVADGVERIAESDAVDVALLQQMLERKHAGKGAEPPITGTKRLPSSLVHIATPTGLVGDDIGLLERSKHFQPREHAVIAVEFASRRLRIDMASSQDHRCRFTRARDASRRCCLRRRFRSVHRPRAANRLPDRALPVKLGKREATHASLRSGADLRQFHERSPEARRRRPGARPAAGAAKGISESCSCSPLLNAASVVRPPSREWIQSAARSVARSAPTAPAIVTPTGSPCGPSRATAHGRRTSAATSISD